MTEAKDIPLQTIKESLRHEALRFRDSIDPSSEDVEQACANFFESLNPHKGQVVAAYWPKGREFDTRGILARLLEEGVACALPVIRKGSRLLGFAIWNDNIKLAEGPFGVLQPEIDGRTSWVDPDIIAVPLLAFDRHGNRLGYGGGYYDATIADLRARKNIVTAGLGYAKQAVLFNLPVEAHDQKLNWIITPLEARYFG